MPFANTVTLIFKFFKMTKQEKIQEAYGKYWDVVKDKYIDDNGWVDSDVLSLNGKMRYNQRKSTISIKLVFWHRPEVLQGIENNNGWIKIESEEDLPKEEINCFYRIVVPERYSNAGVYVNSGRFNFKSMIHSTTQYFTCDDIIRHHFTKVTHYKPIISPNEPLY